MTEFGVALLGGWLQLCLHTTLLLAGVWAGERLGLLRSPDLRELAWRAALLLPVLSLALGDALPRPTLAWAVAPSTTPQATQAGEQGAGRSVSAGGTLLAPDAAQQLASATGPERGRDAASPPRVVALPSPAGGAAPAPMHAAAHLAAPSTIAVPPAASDLLPLAGWAWLGWLLALAAWRLAQWRYESRRIAALPVLSESAFDGAEVRASMPRVEVRLDADLASPAAWPPATVCLPPWSLQTLSRAQRRACLAHEVAHLRRGDPWWRLALGWLARAGLSPLAPLALRRLDALAELACDRWAAQRTGTPRALAESLLHCAEHCTRRPPHPLAVAMADRQSPLLDRIRHLTEDTRMSLAPSGPLRSLLLGGVLLGSALLLPTLAATPAEAGLRFAPGTSLEAPPEPPEAPEAPEAPPAPPATPAPAPSPAPPAPPAPPRPPQPPAPSGEVSAMQWDTLFGSGLRYRVERADFQLELEADGEFVINEREDDFTAVDKQVTLSEKRDGVRRELKLEKSGTALRRTFLIDGREVPFDAAAAAWLAEALPRLLRETGAKAEERVARLHREGGSAAVIAEIDRIVSGHGRSRHLRALFALPDLSAADLEAGVARAALLDSDYERRVTLRDALRHPQLPSAALGAVLDAARGIDSDYERRVLLKAAADRLGDSEALQQRWIAALDGMDSDYEVRVAVTALAGQALRGDALARALAAVALIDSDYEQRVALKALARHVTDAEGIAAWTAALDGIGSDYERRVAVVELLRQVRPDAAGARALLPAIGAIGSDYECRVALQALAATMPKDSELIREYRGIARKLGDFERGQAEKALDRFDS